MAKRSKKGTCGHCERRVSARPANGALVAAVHQGPDDALCPGTGLLVVGPTPPATRKRQLPPRRVKQSTRATERAGTANKKSRTSRRRTSAELAAIRASEALERAAWDSAQQWDVGGRNSVRTVSGGAPTLGKRR